MQLAQRTRFENDACHEVPWNVGGKIKIKFSIFFHKIAQMYSKRIKECYVFDMQLQKLGNKREHRFLMEPVVQVLMNMHECCCSDPNYLFVKLHNLNLNKGIDILIDWFDLKKNCGF